MTKVVEFAKLGGPEVLTYVERDPEPPAPGEVQVAMKAAGLNRAELLFMAGQYFVAPELPSPIGMEGAGEIVAVGPDVESFKAGDRVAITPAFQVVNYGVLGEVVNVPATALEPIAQGMSYGEAAAFWMAYATAYGLLVQKGGLTKDARQTVVLNASSSSVGTVAFQIVRAHGGTSIALTRTAEKVTRLRDAGADHVIVTESEDQVQRVLELSEGRGFDIALDAVAGEPGTTLANAAALEATMVVYGLLAGGPGHLPVVPMAVRGLHITGFHITWSLLSHPERRAAAVKHLSEGFASGAYKPIIDTTFGFDELSKAYQHMASNDQLGKIVVEFE